MVRGSRTNPLRDWAENLCERGGKTHIPAYLEFGVKDHGANCFCVSFHHTRRLFGTVGVLSESRGSLLMRRRSACRSMLVVCVVFGAHDQVAAIRSSFSQVGLSIDRKIEFQRIRNTGGWCGATRRHTDRERIPRNNIMVVRTAVECNVRWHEQWRNRGGDWLGHKRDVVWHAQENRNSCPKKKKSLPQCGSDR